MENTVGAVSLEEGLSPIRRALEAQRSQGQEMPLYPDVLIQSQIVALYPDQTGSLASIDTDYMAQEFLIFLLNSDKGETNPDLVSDATDYLGALILEIFPEESCDDVERFVLRIIQMALANLLPDAARRRQEASATFAQACVLDAAKTFGGKIKSVGTGIVVTEVPRRSDIPAS